MAYWLALISGLLLALSFPRFGHPVFAWVALVPLFAALGGAFEEPARVGVSPARAVRLGLVAGVVHFIGTIYWTGTVVQQFGGVPAPVALVAMLLLAAYMALYPAVACWVTARAVSRVGHAGLWLAAAPWVAGEFARGAFFGGFPWVPLGNSQVTVLPVAQLASLTGVYGLSALVVLVNAGLTVALLGRGRQRAVAGLVTCALLAATAGWGAWRLSAQSLVHAGEPVTVGLVQGDIRQDQKWHPGRAAEILRTHLAMTREAAARGAELVLWPESSTPFMFEEDAVGADAVRSVVRDLRVPLLFGSDQIERGRVPRLFNSAFMLDEHGATRAVYRKMHLVPFGEYIPLKSWLFFVSPLVESLAEFAPGTATVLLPVGSHRISTSICYEVVYPELVRDAVDQGSELLTTITNDAWYGDSSAPYQHFAMASMRAIDLGRYLVRAANTGISGIVDPYGRVVVASGIFERTAVVGEARYLSARTVYATFGDAVAWAAVALTVAMALLPARTPRPWN